MANVEAILDYQVPMTRKTRAFLGYGRLLSTILPELLCSRYPIDSPHQWESRLQSNKGCQESFQQLREFLASNPVLVALNFKKPFILHSDASDSAIGAVLLQVGEHGVLHPVASAKLDKHQRTAP